MFNFITNLGQESIHPNDGGPHFKLPISADPEQYEWALQILITAWGPGPTLINTSMQEGEVMSLGEIECIATAKLFYYSGFLQAYTELNNIEVSPKLLISKSGANLLLSSSSGTSDHKQDKVHTELVHEDCQFFLGVRLTYDVTGDSAGISITSQCGICLMRGFYR